MTRAKWLLLALAVAAGVASWSIHTPTGTDPAPPPAAPSATERFVPTDLGAQSAQKSPKPAPDTGPAKAAVAEYRRRHLSLAPRRLPPEHIALSGARVALITQTALIIHDIGAKRVPLEFPLPNARLVTSVPGALLAVGQDKMLSVPHGAREPQSWPRVTLLPGSQLHSDLIKPERLWVRHAGDAHLYGYALTPSPHLLLPLVSRVELSESREGTFLPLKDGSFIHLAGDHWERFFAQGKRFQLPSPQRHAAPFRVLRAARIDEFFVLYEDGLVERLQLQDRLRVVWSLRLPELPLDIASAGNTLVTLRATRDGSSTSWLLEVVGQNAPKPELIDLGVSAPDSFHDDWVARQLRSHGLTASERWIAVGGGSRLRVWQLKGLELVLDTRLSGRATAASP